MGNDIRTIKPADLAILSNPAIIAINQDPSGSSAARRWIWNTNATDSNFRSTIQMWSGNLKSTTGGTQNDMVVLLINGGNTGTTMNATLADIFADNGAAGTAQQVSMNWEVRDLWVNRMSDEEAGWIIGNSTATGNATTGYNATTVGTGRYNATKTSYAQGLANKDDLLLGKVTTTVQPSGAITATVDPHGARVFRLRAVDTSMAKSEL
jgi:alpha-galactosidase